MVVSLRSIGHVLFDGYESSQPGGVPILLISIKMTAMYLRVTREIGGWRALR